MYYKNIDEVISQLNSSIDGLTSEEAEKRLKIYGLNELEEGKKESRLKLFLSQFNSPLIYILIIAGVIAYFLGEEKDSFVIFGLIFINGLIGFYQELKAISSIEALKKLTALKTVVKRDKKEIEIDASYLVPGDIVFLREGDIVPADIRLIWSASLLVDESILTGESVPVEKTSDIVLDENTPIYNRVNILFKGTTIVKGKAIGIVYATGKNTEIGKIAEKAKLKSPKSPLSQAIADFSKKWVIVLIIILSLIFLIGILQGRSIKDMFFYTVAQLVSAVPEGLPIVLTITLVVGSLRLLRNKTLVKYLPAVETLGSATYICSDKTGTITEGKLKVEKVYTTDEENTILNAILCNDSDGERGDPLEIALIKWVEENNIDWIKIREEYKREIDIPFDTQKRYMAVIVKKDEKYILYIKGAFESLISMSENQDYEKLNKIHDEMAENGLRVLAFGYAVLDDMNQNIEEIKIKITGLIGFLDPPRDKVAEAVKIAKKAGIRIIMITGDNILTAKAIAKSVGIFEEKDLAVEGKELNNLNEKELYNLLKKISVIARAAPEDKFRVVKALQENGEVVAVTGDGVNDVPALKVADLGIAMGSGSEAAKEASKMVITDNNLSVIVNAIKIGRIINQNISKVILYLLSTNIFEIMYLSLAILSGMKLPLYPTHILWINLVTDGVQDKAFPFTKEEKNVLEEKPKKPKEVFIGKIQIIRILYNGIFMGISHFILFYYLINKFSYEIALTISFCSAVISQWSVGIQSIKLEPYFKDIKKSFTINPYIYFGIGIGVLLQFSAIYIFPQFFHVVPLSFNEFLYALILPILIFIAIELRKWVEIFIHKS